MTQNNDLEVDPNLLPILGLLVYIYQWMQTQAVFNLKLDSTAGKVLF